jgi:hypothetical protein
MNSINIEEIKQNYPNEWVLLKVEEESMQPTYGEVLFHSKDYLELCYKGSEIAKNILTTILFTGEQSKRRKWLKATRLQEAAKTI